MTQQDIDNLREAAEQPHTPTCGFVYWKGEHRCTCGKAWAERELAKAEEFPLVCSATGRFIRTSICLAEAGSVESAEHFRELAAETAKEAATLAFYFYPELRSGERIYTVFAQHNSHFEASETVAGLGKAREAAAKWVASLPERRTAEIWGYRDGLPVHVEGPRGSTRSCW